MNQDTKEDIEENSDPYSESEVDEYEDTTPTCPHCQEPMETDDEHPGTYICSICEIVVQITELKKVMEEDEDLSAD